MRLLLLCLPLLLFISSTLAQPLNSDFAQRQPQIVNAAVGQTPASFFAAQPQPQYQAWPPANQFQMPANTLGWNSGAAASQFPLTYTHPTPNAYPSASFQQFMAQPSSATAAAMQQPNPAQTSNTNDGSVAAAQNSMGFSGFLSPEQVQQLALQAAQPTLSQWATDSAQNIFARSRGILNTPQPAQTQQASAMLPPAYRDLLNQQQAAAANSFNFIVPQGAQATPVNLPSGTQMLPNNGQFIPNGAAPPSAANANPPAALAPVVPVPPAVAN